ncbi:alpha/beta hydrolase [Companilactobacillus sp.]|uniref:alpha/beta hydrolase n=1 Tax=Companilactobacillus sp. TaxID=2767905 RepID=UPI0026361F58|nr:alpha/beta hydrolase [Companilactobacillus sp.]
MRKLIKWIFLMTLLLITTVVTVACSNSSNQSQVTTKEGARMVPTLFFHGYGSSTNAENQMANAAVKAGASKTIIKAIVDKDGKVTLKGVIPASEKHPIVEVGYENNRNPNYHQDGQWAKNVIVKLQKVYHIKKFNMVGHSMGNMAIIYYMLDNHNDHNLPKLQKQVDIAGHYNGILGMNDKPNQMQLDANGKPTKMDQDYRQLTALRKTKAYQSVKVLNIYGNKNDGTNSDGRVSNASSKSLKYLIGNQVTSYREKKIIGKNAQHSKLHENKQVDRLLIHFIWNR